MAQQINLYSPILLSTRRYFSAVAMAQAWVVMAIGITALCGWTTWQTRSLRESQQAMQRNSTAEKQALIAAIAANPAQGINTTSLEQNLHTAQQSLMQREQVLAELTRGTVTEGHSHSAVLLRVAQTLPAPVWLTELRLAASRLEVIGLTLDPAALRPWIAALAADPRLAGRPLSTVRVERAAPRDGQGLPRGVPRLNGGLELWSFTLASGVDPQAAQAPAAAGSTPTADAYVAAALAYASAAAASASAQGRIPGATP